MNQIRVLMNAMEEPDKFILSQVSTEVRTFNNDTAFCVESVSLFDTNLKDILSDMLTTMISYGGIGLSAVQIGLFMRVFIMCYGDDILEVINPKIISKNGRSARLEGCLSIPGFSERIERAANISVEFQDRDGETIRMDLSGIDAACFQHELDHLNGIVLLDKVSKLKRNNFLRSNNK